MKDKKDSQKMRKIIYMSQRVTVKIIYDSLISTIEAKETAMNLILNEDVYLYG